jgi:hypothetical protein
MKGLSYGEKGEGYREVGRGEERGWSDSKAASHDSQTGRGSAI